MKVALVHSYYSSHQYSGENVVVDSQLSALRSAGVDATVIGLRTDDLEGRPGYSISAAATVASGRGPSPLKQINALQPDVVHVHNLFPNWGTDWVNKWQGPLVATMHNFRPMCAAGTLFREGAVCTLCPDKSALHAVRHACYRGSTIATLPLAVRNRRGLKSDVLLKRAQRVVLLSPRAKAIYDSFGLPSKKGLVIPNFVDQGLTLPAEPSDSMDEWLYIGRLTPEKGILNLLAHWPSGHKINIIGDGPLRGKVESETTPHIRYLGEVPHSQIAEMLSRSRGLVFPSAWAEGLPLVYAEALASGRPVVAKSGNSAADDIRQARVGAVFDEWDQLEQALDEVISNAEQLGRRAVQHFDREYSVDAWLKRTLRLYESLWKRSS